MCFQAAELWNRDTVQGVFCFVLFLSKWEGEKARSEEMEWRQRKSAAERDQKRSENEVVESMREASVSSSWRPSVKSERCEICNRKMGIASGESSVSQCGRVIGGEESPVHGQEGGAVGETTEKYFRVMEMLLSLIRACCCEADWAGSYSPQVPLVSFFSSLMLGSFVFLLPRPLLIRTGRDHAVRFGAWFNIRKDLYSASKQRALFFLLTVHAFNSAPSLIHLANLQVKAISVVLKVYCVS